MTEKETHRKEFFTPAGVTWLGLVTNCLLAVGKILVGTVFYSQAILADGLHSSSDLVTDLAVLMSLRVSKKPADSNHHYGHQRVSSLVALFIGTALLLGAAWIAVQAIGTFQKPQIVVNSLVPMLTALASVGFKEVLYQLTRLVGKRTHDLSLIANAWHHRTDAFSSVAAAAGLAGVYFGGLEWAFLDQLTAVVLAAFLGVAAVKIIQMAGSDLLDRAPDEETLSGIAEIVSSTHGVRDFHAFRARKIGGNVAVDIHVLVEPTLTVHEGHEIATTVENRVKASDNSVEEVIVHIEPWEQSRDA